MRDARWVVTTLPRIPHPASRLYFATMLALLLALQGATDPGSTYSGIAKQLDVRIPRIETTVKIDGVLDEPAWRRAALLTGFSRYPLVTGRPAEGSADVVVGYAPDTTYVAIRAVES